MVALRCGNVGNHKGYPYEMMERVGMTRVCGSIRMIDLP